MLRGIDGRRIFMDDRDRSRFCLLLQEASEMCHFRIHAFCLMGNHIHLVLEPTTSPLAEGVHRFASRYAQYFNRKYEKRGYVFQGRFRSILVEEGRYLRTLVHYVHLNPVEAGLVEHPEKYSWSSYNAYFKRAVFTWLHTDRVLAAFDMDRSGALARMHADIESKIYTELDRSEVLRAFRRGIFGSEEFVEIYGDDIPNPPLELEKKPDESLEKLVNLLCRKFNVSLSELRSSEKRRDIVRARAAFARTSQLSHDIDLSGASKFLNKSYSSVARLATSAMKNPQLDVLAHHLADNLSQIE